MTTSTLFSELMSEYGSPFEEDSYLNEELDLNPTKDAPSDLTEMCELIRELLDEVEILDTIPVDDLEAFEDLR